MHFLPSSNSSLDSWISELLWLSSSGIFSGTASVCSLFQPQCLLAVLIHVCRTFCVFIMPLNLYAIASCPSGLLCIDIIYSVQIQARPDRLPFCLLCLWEDTFLAHLLTEGKALGVPGFIYEMRFYQPYFSKHNPHFTVCTCVKSMISSYHIHVWKYQRESHIMCNYIVLVFF